MELENVKHDAFCKAYAGNGGNATQAALTAGFSESCAKSYGSRLLKTAEIRGRIQELRDEALTANGIDKDSITLQMVQNLIAIMGTDFLDVVRFSSHDDPQRGEAMDAVAEAEGGQHQLDMGETIMLPRRDLTESQRKAIESLRPVYDSKGRFLTWDIKLIDKLPAMRQLAQLLEIGQPDVEANVSISLADALDRADARVAAGRAHAESLDGRIDSGA